MLNSGFVSWNFFFFVFRLRWRKISQLKKHLQIRSVSLRSWELHCFLIQSLILNLWRSSYNSVKTMTIQSSNLDSYHYQLFLKTLSLGMNHSMACKVFGVAINYYHCFLKFYWYGSFEHPLFRFVWQLPDQASYWEGAADESLQGCQKDAILWINTFSVI